MKANKKRYKIPKVFTELSDGDRLSLVRERLGNREYLETAIDELATILTGGILNPYIADKELSTFESQTTGER